MRAMRIVNYSIRSINTIEPSRELRLIRDGRFRNFIGGLGLRPRTRRNSSSPSY